MLESAHGSLLLLSQNSSCHKNINPNCTWQGVGLNFLKKSYKTTLKQCFAIGKGYFIIVKYKNCLCKNPRDIPIAGIFVLHSNN